MKNKPSQHPALPSGFAEFYREQLGPQADPELSALLAGGSTKLVRVIPSRCEFSALKRLVSEFQLTLPAGEPAVVEFLDDALIVSNELAGRLSQSTAFDQGKFYLQSLPSYLVIKNLPLGEAEYALDVCASPGGKALHLFDRFDRRRPVIVNEPAGARRLRLVSVLKLYGAQELPLLGIDGGLLCQFVANEIPLIVLDAPCSGEAHILSHPQRRKEWTPRQTKMLAQRQLSLAVAAVHALKPSGTLLYSTCALSPFENELLVQELLQRFEGSLEPKAWPMANPAQDLIGEADCSPLERVGEVEIDLRIIRSGWRFRTRDFGEPFFGILLQKTGPTYPKKELQPFAFGEERVRGKGHVRIVKVGPGRREFTISADWPKLPALPYLHLGR